MACAGFAIILFLFLSWRLIELIRDTDFLKDVRPDPNFAWPKVSLIIPACNEEQTIGAAARSLMAMDYPDLQLIVVNDRSNDKTGEIAARLAQEDRRIEVVTIDNLPDGWLGKTHALYRGVQRAKGEWLLFSDADVHYGPQTLKKAVTYCAHENFDFLTVSPDLVTRTLGLKVAMAHVFQMFNFAYQRRRLSDVKAQDAIGSGVFNLVRRSTYEKSEGFEGLKLEIIDDAGLALLMKQSGGHLGFVNGTDELLLEWYSGLGAFIAGIEKNGFCLFQYSLVAVILFSLGVWAIFAATMVVPFVLCKSLGVLFWLYLFSLASYLGLSACTFRRFSKLNPWLALTLPISFVLIPLIVLRSAFLCLKRQGIHWRGTFYPLHLLRREQRFRLLNMIGSRFSL